MIQSVFSLLVLRDENWLVVNSDGILYVGIQLNNLGYALPLGTY